METVHMHLWKQGKQDPVEIDLECTDAYITGDESDHVQFCAQLRTGSIELRIPAAWIKPEVLAKLLEN